METVKHIAGIDLSQSVSQPSMAVVTLTVLAYPSMEVSIAIHYSVSY
jgi:hypothetical protein